MSTPSAPETTYYQDGSIMVTNACAVLGSKTYAMANITSVSMGVIPANRTPGIVVGIIGLAILVCSASRGSNSSGGGIIAGLVVLAIGVAIAFAVKTQYVVKIGSAFGESNALSSADQSYIQKVVNAVNEAIIKRG